MRLRSRAVKGASRFGVAARPRSGILAKDEPAGQSRRLKRGVEESPDSTGKGGG